MSSTEASNANNAASTPATVNNKRIAIGELYKVGISVLVMVIPLGFPGTIYLLVLILSMMYNLYPTTGLEFGFCIDSVWSPRTRKPYIVYVVRAVVLFLLVILGFILWTAMILIFAPEDFGKKTNPEATVRKMKAGMGYFSIIMSLVSIMIAFSVARLFMNIYGFIVALAVERQGESAKTFTSIALVICFVLFFWIF